MEAKLAVELTLRIEVHGVTAPRVPQPLVRPLHHAEGDDRHRDLGVDELAPAPLQGRDVVASRESGKVTEEDEVEDLGLGIGPGRGFQDGVEGQIAPGGHLGQSLGQGSWLARSQGLCLIRSGAQNKLY